jgi:XTP/dITP diphosphohydrolase
MFYLKSLRKDSKAGIRIIKENSLIAIMRFTEVYFATGNKNKFQEAAELFEVHAPDIKLLHFEFDHREIRSDDVKEVAEEATQAAYAKLGKPVFTEDTGLFVDALNGFPGSYSKWVLKKLGTSGLLKLLKGAEDRAARFEAAVSFTDGSSQMSFKGVCEGKIADSERGKNGFGYDPIFVPDGYYDTFAENIELKSKLSHRFKSILSLINYLKS